MRPLAHFSIYCLAAAALAVFAASSAAAGGKLKLGAANGSTAAAGSSHEGEIEIDSFSWGGRAAGGDLGSWTSADGLDVNWDQAALPARGSLTVRARLPGCAPGRTFADAELTTADAHYRFEDLVITGCAASGGDAGALPRDEISFGYGKVTTSRLRPGKAPTTIAKCTAPGSGKPQRC